MISDKKKIKPFPFYKNKKFFNFNNELVRKKTLWGFLKLGKKYLHDFLFLKKSNNQMSSWYELPQFSKHDKNIDNSDNIKVIPMGHATSFIEYKGIRILTDPLFWNISYIVKRMMPCSPQPELLPKIDIIILSHNHRDHCDRKSLAFLYKQNALTKVFVPLGMKSTLISIGFKDVHEYTWWEEEQIDSNIKLTCLPAQHWSQRTLFDHNESLWCSWMISCGGKNIYFAGDTGYSTHFVYIKDHFKAIDGALLPIMPAEPEEVMKYNHMSPEEAIQACIDLGLPKFIPIHWGVFNLGVDSTQKQVSYLKDRMKELGYSGVLCGPCIGKEVIFSKDDIISKEVNSSRDKSSYNQVKCV